MFSFVVNVLCFLINILKDFKSVHDLIILDLIWYVKLVLNDKTQNAELNEL